MPEVIDLSQLKDKDREAVEALAAKQEAEPEDEGLPVRTAFIIAMQDDGSAVVIPDLSVKLKRARIPSQNDMYNGCSQIVKDIASIEAANHTAMAMQQLAAQAQQIMQNQQIAEQLQRAGLKRV